MAAKKYHIETPDQLLQLAALSKHEHKIARVVRAWKKILRKSDSTRWDNSIFAEFSGDRTRVAKITRTDAEGRVIYCDDLKYNLALMWCEKNLQGVKP